MSDVVNIEYGDETIFGRSWAATVDFKNMTLTSEGKAYVIKVISDNEILVDPVAIPSNVPGLLQVPSKPTHLTRELTANFLIAYKRWLKEADPITVIMHEMGYFSVTAVAKEVRGNDT